MAFEKRRGKKYFYESVRVNGRVWKRYIGAGVAGAAAADRLAKSQAERVQRRHEVFQRMQEAKKVEQHFKDIDTQLEAHIHALLLTAGYYRHNRGEWRKRGSHVHGWNQRRS